TGSAGGTIGDFTFTPSTATPLSANTVYWLLVDASAQDYQWRAFSGNPSGAATFGPSDYKTSFDNGVSYFTTGDTPTFNVNATPVPEPAHVTLAAAAGLLIFALCRRALNNRQNPI